MLLTYTFGAFCLRLVVEREQVATNLVQEGQQLARKVIICQSILALIIALLFAQGFGTNSSLSACIGAAIVIVPNIIFVYFAFKYSGARQNNLVVRSFNKGSKIKFTLTLVFFVMAYQWPSLDMIAFLVTYILVLIGQWPFIILISRVKKRS